MPSLFHILAEPDWRTARALGSYAPASLTSDGFVHFSHAHQVAGAANRFYRDQAGLIVVEFDPDRLGQPVVEEDLYGAGEQFPHVYGAIDTAAAIAEHPLPRDARGRFSFAF
ncbi:MAG: DUF952 domain-containing protein [Jatrophihabitans sp.]